VIATCARSIWPWILLWKTDRPSSLNPLVAAGPRCSKGGATTGPIAWRFRV
jgi:hypothetical protein